MSTQNVLNINEPIATVVLAANVATNLTLPFLPEFIEITNSGTGVAYAKAIATGGASMTVPASTFPALPTSQSGIVIQPGASKTYRYSPINNGVQYPIVSMISTAGTTLDVKIGRGV